MMYLRVFDVHMIRDLTMSKFCRGGGLSGGAIAGIVVGAVLAAILAALGAFGEKCCNH
jgi:hypothetical protein